MTMYDVADVYIPNYTHTSDQKEDKINISFYANDHVVI